MSSEQNKKQKKNLEILTSARKRCFLFYFFIFCFLFKVKQILSKLDESFHEQKIKVKDVPGLSFKRLELLKAIVEMKTSFLLNDNFLLSETRLLSFFFPFLEKKE